MFLISSSAIVIAVGLLCLYDAEFAWYLYSKDAELLGRVVQRTHNWKQLVNRVGYALIVLGAVGALVGMRTLGF